MAGAAWYARKAGDTAPTSAGSNAGGHSVPNAEPADPLDRPASPMSSASASGKPAPTHSDPRLAALRVSSDNGLIEFVSDPDGLVIREIDDDPGSPSYRKPLRDYSYQGNSMVGATTYVYLADHVQVTRTRVSYKPDGSVDKFQESTSYEHGTGRGGARIAQP